MRARRHPDAARTPPLLHCRPHPAVAPTPATVAMPAAATVRCPAVGAICASTIDVEHRTKK